MSSDAEDLLAPKAGVGTERPSTLANSMLRRFVVVGAALALAVVAAGAVGPAVAPKGAQGKNRVQKVKSVISEVDESSPQRSLPIKRGRFLYLTQGPSMPPTWLCYVGSRSDSDVIWASFQDEVNTTCEGVTNTIFVQNSSWTAGRNALYAKAIELQQKQGWRAEYLVFTDDDTELYTGHADWNPYDLFHAALGNVQPAVAAVRFQKRTRNNEAMLDKTPNNSRDPHHTDRNVCGPVAPCAPDIDAAVNAFHATAAPILLPYDTVFDDKDWYSSQGILIELMVASMPEHVVQFNQIYFMNSMHRPYPRGLLCVKPEGGGMSEVAQYLQPRVSECMRDQIGLFQIGSSIKCKACQKTDACTDSADCKPVPATNDANASEPINYADVVECKPNLKMGQAMPTAGNATAGNAQALPVMPTWALPAMPTASSAMPAMPTAGTAQAFR